MFLVQNADRVALVQKGIADVLHIGKNLLDVALMPFEISRSVTDVICFQASPALQEACTFQVLSVDATDDLSLLWVDDQITVSVFSVAQEPVVVNLFLALLIAVLDAHTEFRFLSSLIPSSSVLFVLRSEYPKHQFSPNLSIQIIKNLLKSACHV